MKKMIRRTGICFLLPILILCGAFFTDRQFLRQELIHFFEVPASESKEDQCRKLLVKDAVKDLLYRDLKNIADVQKSKDYLTETLPKLQRLVRQTLQTLVGTESVRVILDKGLFAFSQWKEIILPAGIYDKLQLVIGDIAEYNR